VIAVIVYAGYDPADNVTLRSCSQV